MKMKTEDKKTNLHKDYVLGQNERNPLRFMIYMSQHIIHKVMAALAAFMLYAPLASAQIFGPVPDIGGGQADIRVTTLRILNNVLTFMALAAVVFIVIAGVRLIFSQGEDEQRDKARKTVFLVIAGLVLILFAQGIVDFVANQISPQ